MLSAIKQRGYILVSTDPNYEPQSFLNTEGKRPADTKCPSDALTTAEMQGFDVDAAIAILEQNEDKQGPANSIRDNLDSEQNSSSIRRRR